MAGHCLTSVTNVKLADALGDTSVRGSLSRGAEKFLRWL
jgi:hypothetical protein